MYCIEHTIINHFTIILCCNNHTVLQLNIQEGDKKKRWGGAKTLTELAYIWEFWLCCVSDSFESESAAIRCYYWFRHGGVNGETDWWRARRRNTSIWKYMCYELKCLGEFEALAKMSMYLYQRILKGSFWHLCIYIYNYKLNICTIQLKVAQPLQG
jgi:hypothetical protein